MSDIVERLIDGDDLHSRIEAATEITRLRAELAEARPKALREAAEVAYRTCAQARHVQLGDAAAQAIRAMIDKG